MLKVHITIHLQITFCKQKLVSWKTLLTLSCKIRLLFQVNVAVSVDEFKIAVEIENIKVNLGHHLHENRVICFKQETSLNVRIANVNVECRKESMDENLPVFDESSKVTFQLNQQNLLF